MEQSCSGVIVWIYTQRESTVSLGGKGSEESKPGMQNRQKMICQEKSFGSVKLILWKKSS